MRMLGLAIAAAALAADTAEAGAFARIVPPDAALLDQHGAERRFVSELAGEDVVVLSFMFTTCEMLCPVTNQILADLQAALGTGPGVRIVSVSIDTARDTPAALARTAESFDAGPGWTFVTGPGAERLAASFGMRPADIAFHDPVVFVGRADLGRFTQSGGLPTADELITLIEDARSLP